MITDDTITAISSAVAPASRIVVRVSGKDSIRIAKALAAVDELKPSSASQLMLHFADLQCLAWVYSFVSPRSYTGEDSVEFHLPGSPILAQLLLDELYRRGVRAAEPGEFTARAFFNGKIGLTQAEGVAAAIAAGNEAELAAARQLLAGELVSRLSPITKSLAQTLAMIEVGIDFSEEDVTFLAGAEVAARINQADAALRELIEQSRRFELLNHEPRVVLAGRPNAGKSSLINALTRQSRAVVSEMAGTTRDVLTAPLNLPRGRVILADVAGLDSESLEATPQGQIDRDMQQRARRAIEAADHVILIRDSTDHRPDLELQIQPAMVVFTKADLFQATAKAADSRSGPALMVSSTTGQNLEDLRAALDLLAFAGDQSRATLALNRRHLQSINNARESLTRASARASENAAELVAMDLRDVLDALGTVTGEVTPDDVLGLVFSAFCIGK